MMVMHNTLVQQKYIKSLIKVGTLTDTDTVKPALNDTMN